MKNRHYVLGAAVVVAVLCASASALVIDSPVIWSDRTAILDQTDGYVEIVAGGSLTANARVDHDGGVYPAGEVILNGGDLTSTVDYKHPDHNTGNPAFLGIYDGTFTANVFESFGPNRDATIEIGANGTMIVESGYSTTWDLSDGAGRSAARRNVAYLLSIGTFSASPGLTLVVTDVGGGEVQISAGLSPRATGPSPADGTDAVSVETDLIWTPAVCMTSQDVWFTTDPNLVTDPNFLTDHPELRIASDFTGTTISNALLNGGNPLEPLTTYYWRVDSAGGGPDPNFCPAYYAKDGDGKGDTWTFTTGQLAVQITSQPVSEVVLAGVEAVFQVETDRADLIEWYKVGQAGALVTGGDITIEPIDVNGVGTLRISNPEGNEGEYYCIVYNSLPSQEESEHVYLYTEKLLAHWKFENALTCEVDSSNDGSATPLAASYVTSVDTKVPGAAGNAVDLTTAPNQIVRVVDSAIGVLPKMTVSLWMKANIVEGGGVQAALLRADGAGGDTVPGAVSMRLNSGNIEIRVQGVDNRQGAEPVPGEWYHYVGTYDGIDEHRMRLYINGVLDGTDLTNERGAEALAHISSLTIGGWYDGIDIVETFDGQIDDVRIYNYELTPLEVASLYTDWVDTYVCLGLSPAAQAVDLVENCRIDLADLAALAELFLECARVPDCEFGLP